MRIQGYEVSKLGLMIIKLAVYRNICSAAKLRFGVL